MKACFLIILYYLSSSYCFARIQVVTDNYPPFSISDSHGRIKGVGTDVVRAVIDNIGDEAPIRAYNWTRAYQMALHQKDTLIYPIIRTPERELLFQWVGVIVPTRNYLIAKEERTDIVIFSIEDAKTYRIGTVKNDMADIYLRNQGFDVDTNLEHSPDYAINMKKLLNDRIDLMFCAKQVCDYLIKQLGLEQQEGIQYSFFLATISNEGMYMAFSLQTPETTVERYRKALQTIKTNGLYQQILQKSSELNEH